MPTPPVPTEERIRRKAVIETLLKMGYHPQGESGGIASATKTAERTEGVNYPRWVRDEESFAAKGKVNFAVDWTLYAAPPAQEADAVTEEDEEGVDPAAHAGRRAELLTKEVIQLLTKSRYPVVNPEAIVVDQNMVRRYDRDSLDYEMVPGKPRTWISDTLRVEPVTDCRGKTFIFASAQNDTDVHMGFWRNLQAYAAELDAEIVIGPLTYETQWWAENDPIAREYDPEISEYLCFGQMRIGQNFIFAGEMNTLATANKPISDLVTYSRGVWGVFPHPKRQLQSVPSTDPSTQAHQVMTTGSVTKPKVIPRKAGIKSVFHHVIGAVIVEFDEDGDVFCRHISANKQGSFYDLDAHVKDGKVTYGNAVKAMTGPDFHAAKAGPVNVRALYGFDIKTGKLVNKHNLLDLVKPQYLFVEDIFDNETRNHHHVHDVAHAYRQAYRGRDNVLNEIRYATTCAVWLKRDWMTTVIVESNHDTALNKYVLEGRYRGDGINHRLGLQLEDRWMQYEEEVADALDEHRSPPKFSLLEHAMRNLDPDGMKGIVWAYDGTSFKVGGVECGHHGHRGANGAKGTVAGFARLGAKMSIGDKHSPAIEEGVYVAGAMELQHGYNKGPSGWAVTVILQYQDDKRTLVTLQKGKIRGGKRARASVLRSRA